MAKYGECTFGTGKYGTGETCTPIVSTGNLRWVIKIGWDGINFINEAQYVRDLRLDRGTKHYLTHSGGGFEPMPPSKLYLLLENINGRFDPNNAASPLYPNVRPGLRIIVSVRDMTTGQVHHLFRGRIEDIRPTSSYELVEITASDFMAWIDSRDVTIPDTFGITISEAIERTLTEAGIGRINIQDEPQKMVYFGVDRANAAGVLQMLADACLGTIFVDKAGTCKFYNRALTGMATHSLDQAELLKNIEVSQPWDNLRNDITVAANRWVKTSVHTIWTSPGTINIDASETKTFSVNFTNPSEIVPPEYKLDYVVVSPTDKLPSDTLGASVSVTMSGATSRGCTLTIVNNNSTNVSITKLRLRGKEYLTSYTATDPRSWLTPWGTAAKQTVSTKVTYNENDSSSISVYGKRSFVLDNPYLQDANHAEKFAELLLDHLRQPKKEIVASIEDRSDKQFAIDIMDKIQLSVAKLGISGTYYVGGLEHKWLAATGQAVLTKLYLQDRLTSTDAIENESLEILEIPDIPDDPPQPYYDPYLPFDPYNPDDPYNTTCLSKYREMPTGPYYLDISGTIVSNSESSSKTGYYPCTLRSSENTYQSYVAVQGLLETSTDSGQNWKKSTDWSVVTVDFMQGDTAIISRTGSSDWGSSQYHPFPAVPPSPTGITGVRVSISGSTDSEWTTTTLISSGEVQGNNAYGDVMLSNPTPGNVYAAEVYAGIIYAGGGYWGKNYAVNWGLGWKNAGGLAWNGFNYPESAFIYYTINGDYTKVWFIAQSNQIGIRFNDYLYSDNTGSLSWRFYGATSVSTQNRLRIDRISLVNVCPPM